MGQSWYEIQHRARVLLDFGALSSFSTQRAESTDQESKHDSVNEKYTQRTEPADAASDCNRLHHHRVQAAKSAQADTQLRAAHVDQKEENLLDFDFQS